MQNQKIKRGDYILDILAYPGDIGKVIRIIKETNGDADRVYALWLNGSCKGIISYYRDGKEYFCLISEKEALARLI